MPESKPSTFEIWWTAARPHTLTASLSPCLVSCAANKAPWHIHAAWFVFCLTVQLGTNLHNDYSDYVQGADNDKRKGHARATAKGWLTPTQTCQAATGCLTITLLCGLYLIFATSQLKDIVAWFLVLSSVFNAFAYTAGPYPLGYIGLEKFSIAYAGLGDLFVLLYFGYVAVLMVPYLLYRQGESIDWETQFIFGTCVGLLATNIIVVNNLRDRHSDIEARKMTTSVRFGKIFSLSEYVLCVTLAFGLIMYQAINVGSPIRLLPLLSLPLAIQEVKSVFKKEGEALNQHVGGAAKVQLIFCIFLVLSILITRTA